MGGGSALHEVRGPLTPPDPVLHDHAVGHATPITTDTMIRRKPSAHPLTISLTYLTTMRPVIAAPCTAQS